MFWKVLIYLSCICLSVAHRNTCPVGCTCDKNDLNCSKKSLVALPAIDTNYFYDRINVSDNSLGWLPYIIVKNLDVSSNVLHEFPVLSRSIETLTLKNNSIRFARSQECPFSLKHLDLTENPIKEVNLACDGLEILDLSHGDVEILPDKFFSKFPVLKVFKIDNNPLKKINGDLSSDTLEVLSLQQTQLRYIKPGLFTNLHKINVINISGNKHIHTLNPISSTELFLANNCALEFIDLSGMPRVRGVEISNNHLTNLILPDSVLELKARNNLIFDVNLKRIKKADLSRNSIVSVQLQPMEFLNISGNPINHLWLTSISFLDASLCRLSSIDVNGAKFQFLNLSHNSLEAFPDLINARKLDVSYNRLSKFMTTVIGVEEVWLEGNRLVLAEDVLPQGKLHLADNPWTCDCRMDHLYRIAHNAKFLKCSHPTNVSGMTWHNACYKSRIPQWMLERPYIPFVISIGLLILAMFFFYWLRRKLSPPPSTTDQEETTNVTETDMPEVRINNQLPSYEEALLMPGITRKKNALTQTRSYEVLSRRLSSNSI